MAAKHDGLKVFPIHELEDASDDYAGFCLVCGYRQDPVEPDARGYKCEECGKRKVYGAEEIMLMGLVEGWDD